MKRSLAHMTFQIYPPPHQEVPNKLHHPRPETDSLGHVRNIHLFVEVTRYCPNIHKQTPRTNKQIRIFSSVQFLNQLHEATNIC